MALSETAISIIGRHHAEIFDLYGNPFGPYGHVHVAAHQHAALNPQPLPPALRSGIAAAFELVEVARFQHLVRGQVSIEVSDYCGNEVHPPIPVPPGGGPQPDPWADYHLGLAFALELTAHAWEHTELADSVEKVHAVALEEATRRFAQG
ncbi:hypothetical protein [Cellulomonas sp. URHE0023]|uniref:hypothetical protein n=1 Tax=Cellulomonas sp. URHE0023 TaxID=1380354 RepID=UPI0012DF6518|nr:hypothetical protein [Cellulomonas sp. URHE0023]